MPSAVASGSAAATILKTPTFGPTAVRTPVTSVVCGGLSAMACSWWSFTCVSESIGGGRPAASPGKDARLSCDSSPLQSGIRQLENACLVARQFAVARLCLRRQQKARALGLSGEGPRERREVQSDEHSLALVLADVGEDIGRRVDRAIRTVLERGR